MARGVTDTICGAWAAVSPTTVMKVARTPGKEETFTVSSWAVAPAEASAIEHAIANNAVPYRMWRILPVTGPP